MTNPFLQRKWNCVKKVFFFFYVCGVSTRFRVMPSPYGASQSHSDTPHLVGLLCTSGKNDAGISTCQHITLTKDKIIHVPVGLFYVLYCARTHNPSKQATAYPCLRLRGYRFRHVLCTALDIYYLLKMTCDSDVVGRVAQSV
jgi:hypothetical protein